MLTTIDELMSIKLTSIKLTLSAIIDLVKKFRAKGAKKTLVADVNSMINNCTDSTFMEELTKLKDDGITHVAASVDMDGKLVDDIVMIKNQDSVTDSEVVDLLGDDGMVVIEG